MWWLMIPTHVWIIWPLKSMDMWGTTLQGIASVVCYVTKEIHVQIINIVTKYVKEVVETLIAKLHSHFPSHGVMEALGVVFLQYWLMENCDEYVK
jgi:hypothetical protein